MKILSSEFPARVRKSFYCARAARATRGMQCMVASSATIILLQYMMDLHILVTVLVYSTVLFYGKLNHEVAF